jgi:hypothetical protein
MINKLLKIFYKNFLLILVLISFFKPSIIYSDLFNHSKFDEKILEKIENNNFSNEYSVKFKNNDFLIQIYQIDSTNFIKNTSIIVKDSFNEPFLYLTDLGLVLPPFYKFNTLEISPPKFKCLEIDTFINKFNFSKTEFYNLVKIIIDNLKLPYNYIKFKNDPFDSDFKLLEIHPSVKNILSNGISLTESFNTKRLLCTKSKREFNVEYFYDWYYKDIDQFYLFEKSQEWIYNLINLSHFKNYIQTLESTKFIDDFKLFLNDCDRNLSFYQNNYLSNIFNNILSLKEKTMKNYIIK